ncbi:hypothetical protein LQ757_18840 [Agromyces sp. SYSU K20354]|uniref:hypothetical protein n=1 Tax=Agromyces cavernae TaxID=2898659 RepID=UPI001E388703|nr:hypothetical protein [Agromyces cavernae]MCD2444342.1 hypothetical protein [Agromyces cavernae]
MIVPAEEVDQLLAELPIVRVIEGDTVDARLHSSVFLAALVNRTLDGTPITLHRGARERRRTATVV